jgi:hypothetical protein
MGMGRDDASIVTVAPMVALSALLVLPSVALSLCSWVAGSGAIMEMWAVRP